MMTTAEYKKSRKELGEENERDYWYRMLQKTFQPFTVVITFILNLLSIITTEHSMSI